MASKQALAGAILDLVADDGEAKVSITEVCRRANVTRPTFYQHYRSLDDLLGDVVANRLAEHQDAAFALDPDQPAEAFDASLSRFLDLIWDDRRLVQAIRTDPLGSNPSQKAAVEAITQRILGRVGHDRITAGIRLRARFAAAGTVELLSSWLRSDDPESERATYVAALQDLTGAAMAVERPTR